MKVIFLIIGNDIDVKCWFIDDNICNISFCKKVYILCKKVYIVLYLINVILCKKFQKYKCTLLSLEFNFWLAYEQFIKETESFSRFFADAITVFTFFGVLAR